MGECGEERQTSRAVVPKDAWGRSLTGMGLYPHSPVSMGGGWRGHAAPVGCCVRWREGEDTVGECGEERQTSRAVEHKDAWGRSLTGMGLYPHCPLSMVGRWRGHAAPVGCCVRWREGEDTVGASGEERQTSRAAVPKDTWGHSLTGMGLYPHSPVSMGGGWRGHAASVGFTK